MDITLLGTGGARGWPDPACACASCQRLRAAGESRAPTAVLIDGTLRLPAATAGAASGGAPGGAPGYDVRTLRATDGTISYDVTAPDGRRLLFLSAPGELPDMADAKPYDVALLDATGRPDQLGALRHRGVVTDTTDVLAVHLDHRLPSLPEEARLLASWGVRVVPDGTVVRAGERHAPSRPRGPYRVLVLGGARSGKSAEAESRLAAEPEVTYVATGEERPEDPEWQARVAAHRARRPSGWHTLETTDLVTVLREEEGPLLVDGIGSWLTAILDECGAWEGGAEEQVSARTDELIAAWRSTSAYVVGVSEEVGLGVVPATASGRRFRDELGRLNARLAAESEEVALIVAGRVVPLVAWP